jgi:hypothetical protein
VTVGRRWAGLAALAWVLAAETVAAQVTVRSEVDAQKIGVQDLVQFTVTISGATFDGTPMPALTNLDLVGSPSVSTQATFGSGGVSQTQSFTYILKPRAVGKAEIGEIRAKAGTTDHVAPPIPIEVVPGSIRPRSTPAPDPFDPFGAEDPLEALMRRRGRANAPDPRLFIEAVPNRTRVHVGEAVLLTYYLYTDTDVRDLRFIEPPKYAGFWTEDLEKPQPPPGGEPVPGQTYRRFPLFQKLLFPTKAGTATIPPATLKIGLAHVGFFGPPSGTTLDRSTKPVTITVDPIPEEPDFSGAVGRFTASASVDHAEVGLGEAVSLRFELQGNGNLKWVDRGPEVKVAGAKVYPPQTKSDLHASTAGITGTKTWEYVVVPETSGTLQIPALPFSYFDVEKRQLVHSTTAPITVAVRGGTAAPAGGSTSAAPAAARGSGPLPIRSDLDLPSRALPTVPPLALTIGVLLMLAAHVVLWLAPRLLERGGEAAGGGRTRNARRALAELQRAGRDGLSKEASVSLIEKALHDVFGPLDERSTEIETDRERAARDVLQDVQFIRYAPQLGDYSEQIREVARRAADVVRRWA